MVKEITSKEQYDEVIKVDKVVVIDCYATWCGPCKAIAPKVENFSKTYENVDFYKVDVDKLPDVASALSVRAMPTFIFFKNGQKVHEVVGANPSALETAIKNQLAAAEAK